MSPKIVNISPTWSGRSSRHPRQRNRYEGRAALEHPKLDLQSHPQNVLPQGDLHLESGGSLPQLAEAAVDDVGPRRSQEDTKRPSKRRLAWRRDDRLSACRPQQMKVFEGVALDSPECLSPARGHQEDGASNCGQARRATRAASDDEDEVLRHIEPGADERRVHADGVPSGETALLNESGNRL